MHKGMRLTKILAAAGCVLLWLPLAAPLVFSIMHFIGSGEFLFDFLMPFELFPLVLLGSGLLIWAAVRSKLRRKLIMGGFGLAVALMVLGLVLAQVSGLASGRIEPDGTWNTIVMGMILASFALLVVTAVGGILLLRDLNKRT